jgi:hypothetical protein
MKIGETEDDLNNLGRRDAFHVAAILVFSEQELAPSDNVRFEDNNYLTVIKSDKNDRHAIVDPFIEKAEIGKLFWVLLVPDAVKGLAHHFDLNFNDVPQAAVIVPPEEEDDDVIDDDGCKGCW